MGFGGLVLRFFNLAIRILQTLDAAVILAIYSYFMAIQTKHNVEIPQWMRAVEGLSGAATLYGLLGCLFTCCLGGVAFFAFLAIVLDVAFVGAMVAIAVLTRDGPQTCQGQVDTPLGSGKDTDDSATKMKFGMACQLEKVVFAVSIIGIFFFLVSVLFQVLYARHHKREKRFGPSPANNYTYGRSRGRGLFWRRNKNNSDNNIEDTLPTHPTPHDVELGTNAEKTSNSGGGMFSRNKNNASPTPYGYGGSAYTGNY